MPLGGRSLVLNTMPPDGSDEQLISAESSVRLPAVTSPKAASKVQVHTHKQWHVHRRSA